ncbi:MAG: site-2 protease family protein [Candidatus Pacebacteria bacterium]|nr:site-2 protease family protein [Candidatus Paceibacterota bacterium]
MLPIILIAFISLIILLTLHEFSHFIMAKKFGVEVQEFGIGYPPKLIGKKFKDTIYSLNLIPFGAFIKVNEKDLKNKPIWQRGVIISAGIVSFWIISAVIISLIFYIGAPAQVLDEEINLKDPKVQIVSVVPDSPAGQVNLQIGDTIQKLEINDQELIINKIGQVQTFTEQNKGKEVVLTIMRGNEVLEINIIPRVSPPQGQGSLGIGLARTAIKKYSFFQAIWQGILTTINLTWQIILGLYQIFKNLILRKPSGAEIMGPVGIMDIFVKAGSLGFIYFLQTIALISLNVAVINALPIPVVDGGRLAFLALEKIRKKPLSDQTEQKINAVFFLLLILMMVFVTAKDIGRLF